MMRRQLLMSRKICNACLRPAYHHTHTHTHFVWRMTKTFRTRTSRIGWRTRICLLYNCTSQILRLEILFGAKLLIKSSSQPCSGLDWVTLRWNLLKLYFRPRRRSLFGHSIHQFLIWDHCSSRLFSVHWRCTEAHAKSSSCDVSRLRSSETTPRGDFCTAVVFAFTDSADAARKCACFPTISNCPSLLLRDNLNFFTLQYVTTQCDWWRVVGWCMCVSLSVCVCLPLQTLCVGQDLTRYVCRRDHLWEQPSPTRTGGVCSYD